MIVIFNRDNALVSCVTLSIQPGNRVEITPEYFAARPELLQDALLSYQQQHGFSAGQDVARYAHDLVIALRGAGLHAALAPDEARMALVRLSNPTYTAEVRARLIGEIINMSPKHLEELNADLTFS